MKKNNTAKLILKKETLQQLVSEEKLEAVAGGTGGSGCLETVHNCDPPTFDTLELQ